MIEHLETPWCQPGYLRRTGVYVVHAIATLAQEVMVMVPCGFKAGRLPRQVNGCHYALFDEQIQIAVHRREVEIGNLVLSERQKLMRQ